MPEEYRRSGIRLLPLLLGALAIGFIAVKGCQEGPFGRKQIVAMNPQQESQLGLQAYQEVLSKSQVLRSGPIVDSVKDITRRLVRATQEQDLIRLTRIQPPEFEWSVSVVQSKEVNAFCLPGGKMVVYTAILPVAETDAGLAVVMGHEISHALSHHGAERMAQQQMVQIGVGSAGASLGDMSPESRAGVMRVLNSGAQYGILSYSRKHESEADRMGLLLMSAAGYDPRESVRFWERMQRMSGGGKQPEFASTHPSHETRIKQLNDWMPQAMTLFEKSQGATTPRRLPLPGTESFRGR